MSEPLIVALVAAGLVAVAMSLRMAALEFRLRALSRLDAKLDALLKHAGVHFDPYADIPPAVVDALRRGMKIEAIKAHRAATGADLREAKEYVEEIQRRGADGR